MDERTLMETIARGETNRVEFKRCGNRPGNDLYESLCAFANGFGGIVLLGVEDDGTPRGIDPGQVLPVTRNILNVVNNATAFDVPIPLEFDHIEVGGRHIVKVSVPNSPQIHSFKGKVYERRGDSDVVVRGSIPLAELCIRKQGIYTEKRIFEHVSLDDLRPELISRARTLAVAKRKDHPWGGMSDRQLVESAGFYGKDFATGETGYNLAAVVTLGRDEVIRSLCPAYKTDAIVRPSDAGRYEDRMTVATNLMDAYRLLAEFGRKHLPDRFLMEGDHAVSARDTILRELLVNCLIHREFTSPFPAKVVIDERGIRTENASRASFEGPLEPDSFNPLPKNPLIAAFFAHIGLAEELGSGVRELFRSSRLYTGRDPEITEGVVFRAFVPLAASDAGGDVRADASPGDIKGAALALAAGAGGLRTSDLVERGYSRRTAQRVISSLVDEGALAPHGSGRGRTYRIR